jgi:hypothetical protein
MIMMKWRVRGPLQLDLVERAVAHVIERHDLLRAEAAIEGEFVRIRPAQAAPFRLAVSDLSGLPEVARAAVLAARCDEMFHRKDRLAALPLRMLAVRQAADDHLLIGSISHVFCDGFSLVLFQIETKHVYDSLARGEPPRLPSPLTTFWNWVDAIDADRQSAEYRAAQEFYERMLGPTQSADLLPADCPRVDGRPTDVFVQRLIIDGPMLERLKERAAAAGATLYFLFNALFVRRLYLWTGRAERLVGIPTAGREIALSGIEGVFGCIAALLPLRTTVRPGESFASLLTRVSHEGRQAFRHLGHRVERRWKPSVVFTFPYFSALLDVAGEDGPLRWEIDEIRNEIGDDDVDLLFLGTVDRVSGEDRLILNFTAQRALFKQRTLERLAADFMADIRGFASGEGLPAIREEQFAAVPHAPPFTRGSVE